MKFLLIAILGCLTAAAQTPPPILRLIRVPKAAGFQTLYANAGANIEVLAMRSVTGLGETWLVEQHPTFASIEDLDKALLGTAGGSDPSHWVDGSPMAQDEVLGPSRTIVAFFRDGWGYRSDDAIRMLPRARYFLVTVYRMRPDSDQDMEPLMKQRHQRLDGLNANQPDLVYHVISGASSGLYFVLAPMVSLRTMDDRLARMPLEVEPKQTASAVIGRESLLFRIDPGISYVSDEFAAADRAFWRGQ